MKATIKIGFFSLVLLLVACQGPAGQNQESSLARPVMGPGSGMMARHHATIPEEYTGLTNPLEADEDTIARGAEIYRRQCASCHGEQGMGDGPAAGSLDPQPAPLSQTGRMLSDDYLFWRISEGGAQSPFNSAMPAWKSSLDEEERWSVISYVRQISGGQPAATTLDPQAEAEQRDLMLEEAVAQDVITKEEAELFDGLHGQMDVLLAARGSMSDGMMRPMMGPDQNDLMAILIDQGTITEEEAQAFNDIHDRLLAAGLMN